MNIVEIIKKAPKDHVYWCTLFGSCRVELIEKFSKNPICVRGAKDAMLTEDGRLFFDAYDGECILFPSKDDRNWAEFERELDGKERISQKRFKPALADDNFSDIEMVSIPDRPMMAAVIMSGLLAGGCKDSAGVLANKAVHYADIILKHTEEESK